MAVDKPALLRRSCQPDLRQGLDMNKVAVANWSELKDRAPAYALVGNVDLVVIRYGDDVSVLYGRCLHRGALLADGRIDGDNLICGLHDWDYRIDTGISEYNNDEVLPKFAAWIDGGKVLVDADEIAAWEKDHPQPYKRDSYLGLYAEVHADTVEPHVQQIQHYADARPEQDRPSRRGRRHGRAAAGAAVLGRHPVRHRAACDRRRASTTSRSAPRSWSAPMRRSRCTLKIPLIVSDMSFGSLSEPAKVALARGAELAGTGIASGEGGMLAEEQAANSRYFYEYASARFGFAWEKVMRVQAFHFKGGQAAKTGTGGHLPGTQERRQDRAHPRPAGRHRRDLAGALPGLDRAEADPRLRRRGAQPHRRHPDRLQALRPAHREGHRRRARGRLRLHHRRRPRRRDRRRAADLPRQHLGADDPGAGARARAISTRAARTSR